MIEPRHRCTYCNSKRNKSKMYEVFYPLIHKYAWHCKTCYEKIEQSEMQLANNVTLLAELEKEERPPFTINERYIESD